MDNTASLEFVMTNVMLYEEALKVRLIGKKG